MRDTPCATNADLCTKGVPNCLLSCSSLIFLQPQLLASLGGGGNLAPHRQHDIAGAHHEFSIAFGEHALRNVDVVLQADTDVSASQPRLSDDGNFHPANSERRPCGPPGQEISCVQQGLGRRRKAVFDAHDEGPEARPFKHAFLDQIQRQMNIARVEDLEFRLDAGFANRVSASCARSSAY